MAAVVGASVLPRTLEGTRPSLLRCAIVVVAGAAGAGAAAAAAAAAAERLVHL